VPAGERRSGRSLPKRVPGLKKFEKGKTAKNNYDQRGAAAAGRKKGKRKKKLCLTS